MEDNLELYILNCLDKIDILEKSTATDLRKILSYLNKQQVFAVERVFFTKKEIERLRSKDKEGNKDLISLLLDVRLEGLYLELRRIQVDKEIIHSFLDGREEQE